MENTTRKLINTNRNTERMFSSVNYSEFYWWKYSLGIYRGSYSGKKRFKKKTKKYYDVSFIPTELPMVLIPSVNSSVNCSHLLNIVHHVNYKWNYRQNCLSVFSRELWNCSFLNWTVNYCSLQMKSSTDWKVVDAIWRVFEFFY